MNILDLKATIMQFLFCRVRVVKQKKSFKVDKKMQIFMVNKAKIRTGTIFRMPILKLIIIWLASKFPPKNLVLNFSADVRINVNLNVEVKIND